ncbi:MAG: hypothetical protein EXS31_10100 [Pedosphaera sp.]|nr:hypothetical protein [Pedosphaera sp.]
MKKIITTLSVIIACACFLGTSASALNFTSAEFLGIIETGEPASIANEVGYVNTLLAQASPSGPTTISGHNYTRSSNPDLGSGSVSDTDAVKDESGGVSVPAGYEYLLAKYDGPNAGDVLWYLGGAAATIPANSFGLWVNRGGTGYGISHFTVFNPGDNHVPDGGMPLVMLGTALTGLGVVRRFVKR